MIRPVFVSSESPMPFPNTNFYPYMNYYEYGITIPDGAGGFQTFALPDVGETVDASGYSGGIGQFESLLTYLQQAWGEIACRGLGVLDTGTTISGNTTFGSV